MQLTTYPLYFEYNKRKMYVKWEKKDMENDPPFIWVCWVSSMGPMKYIYISFFSVKSSSNAWSMECNQSFVRFFVVCVCVCVSVCHVLFVLPVFHSSFISRTLSDGILDGSQHRSNNMQYHPAVDIPFISNHFCMDFRIFCLN